MTNEGRYLFVWNELVSNIISPVNKSPTCPQLKYSNLCTWYDNLQEIDGNIYMENGNDQVMELSFTQLVN